MAVTINLANNIQSNFVPVVVLPIPAANPQDLIWSVGPTAPTLAGPNGAIFSTIIKDNILPPLWYHGGRPIIDVNTLSFAGCNIIGATYTTKTVVSGQRNKGINEINKGNTLSVSFVSSAFVTTVGTTTPHGLVVGDLVYIENVVGLGVAGINAYWYVAAIPSSTTFELLGYNAGGTAGAGGTVQRVAYKWDEVYTTPLGLYDAVTDGTSLTMDTFSFTNDDSNEVKIWVTDPNIIPQIGDSIVFQRHIDNNPIVYVNQSTTDGVNNVYNYHHAETYVFAVTNVTSTSFVSPAHVEYTLTLDKSFAPIINTPSYQYVLVLLNRLGSVTLNKELYSDVWHPYEVHREQLLGDPYNYVGVLQPQGRKNYLYYEGSKFLGIEPLLRGIIDGTSKTPFMVLDWDDELKDRINFDLNDVEIHLPNVMFQGEYVPPILTNNNIISNPQPVSIEVGGVNRYSPLYLKSATSDPTRRYGWVFFDLRIIVIDDAELATALGYASKRNYILPEPFLPLAGNNKKNSGPTNPLTITNAASIGNIVGNPVIVTTSAVHNFINGDEVIVQNVLGNLTANTPPNTVFYVSVINATQFTLYQDILLTIPVQHTGNYISGTGICFGTKLPFEYFLTYRIKGPHYKTLPYAKVIPFNFQSSGLIDNTNGSLEVDLDQLTWLVDNNVPFGFEADEWEVIIGKYVPSLTDPYAVDSITDVVYLFLQSTLLKSGGVQNASHQMLINFSDYSGAVGTYDYELITADPIWNLLGSIPATMYISEGKWLLGNVIYREHAEQYRMTFTFSAPSDKWNGTQNPTFVNGDPLMTSKFITEIGFILDDSEPIDRPYIYGKVSPPIKKDNSSNLNFEISIDF